MKRLLLIGVIALMPLLAWAANDLATNPLEVDTAFDDAVIRHIVYLEWHPNATDDDLEVTDADGNMLWKLRATFGAPNSESFGIETSAEINRMVRGLNVVTIDGGTLYVHMR